MTHNNKPSQQNRLALLLMSKKGLVVLKAINENYPQLISFVVTKGDSYVKNDYCREISEYCKTNDIICLNKNEFKGVTAEYYLAVSWRWLLNTPKNNTIILHDSLLPKYRGFNPLVSALINKEKNIGVTAILANVNYDCGDIVYKHSTKIEYPIKIRKAIDLLIPSYVKVALYVANKINSYQEITAVPQDSSKATYSVWRDEDDYFIDWSQSSEQIKRFIDSVGYPYASAATRVNGKVIRIVSSSIYPDVKIENRDVGKVIFKIKGMPVVICGEGLLLLEDIRTDSSKATKCLSRFRNRFY